MPRSDSRIRNLLLALVHIALPSLRIAGCPVSKDDAGDAVSQLEALANQADGGDRVDSPPASEEFC